MKAIIFIICIYIFCTNAAYSQSFSVKSNPDSTTLGAGSSFKSIISILPESGYNATVFLSAESKTLASLQISHNQVNFPYPTEITVTAQTSIADTGIHSIIIEGKNGQFSAKETIKLLLIAQSTFKTYKTYMPVHNLGITSENVVYGLSYTKQYFLGKIENEIFSFGTAWDNYVEDNRFGSRRLLEADQNNHLWAAQSGKIGKFDGKFWTLYPLDNINPNSYQLVRNLLIDSSNRVWYHSDPDAPASVQYSSIIGMIDNGSVFRMDSSLKSFLTNEKKPDYIKVDQLACDSDGSVWVTATVSWRDFSKTYEMFRYRQNAWENIDYPGKDTAIHVNGTQNYNFFIINPKGGIILSTYNYTYQPISQFERINNQWAPSKYSQNEVTHFSFDLEGRAFQFKGSSFRRWEDSNWVSYELPFTFSSIGSVVDTEVDNYNNIWMATAGSSAAGIVVYNPDGVRNQVIAGIDESEINYTLIESLASPNPTQNSTTFHYSLKTESPVSISIYNSLGIEVFKNNLGFKNAGANSEIISTRELPSGQYYYVLKAGAQLSTQALVIVR